MDDKSTHKATIQELVSRMQWTLAYPLKTGHLGWIMGIGFSEFKGEKELSSLIIAYTRRELRGALSERLPTFFWFDLDNQLKGLIRMLPLDSDAAW